MSDSDSLFFDRLAESLFPHAAEDENAVKECRLLSSEWFWRDHYLWLEEKGYTLRPRYHPEWVASWKGTTKYHKLCEDGQVARSSGVLMDATRISDGTPVLFKKIQISEHPDEPAIGRLFSTEPHASHPSNHCVPIYDVLIVPEDEGTIIIAMPLLYHWETPNFETVGEVVDFFKQLFEGLQYMHSLEVAHNDVKVNNVMMDASNLFDGHPHPVNNYMTLDYTHPIKMHLSRVLRPVKYYHIDFGKSKRYNLEDGPPREYVRDYGGDPAPEFRTEEYCDPFPVDVYRVGNLIRKSFTHRYKKSSRPAKRGLGFMKPLLRDMCQDDPRKRPTMDEVVARFSEIVEGLSSWKLRSRIVSTDEPLSVACRRSPGHWVKQMSRILRRIPAIPSP